MSFTITTKRTDATGDGATTVYPYAFPISGDSELEVIKATNATPPVETTLALTTDYTVSGSGTASGGNVTLLVALPLNYHLTIRRKLTLSQQTDIRNQGAFFPEIHEDAFDGFVKMILQLQEQVDRALTFAKTSIKAGFTMADPVALKYLRWNAAATAIENADPTTAGGVAYIPPSNAVVTDATIQAAMDNFNPRFHGTRGAPGLLVAGTALVPDTKVIEQTWCVAGSAAPITVSANPRIGLTGLVAGQRVRLIGCSDANWVLYDGDPTKGLILNGPCKLGSDTVLETIFDGVNLLETGRKNEIP